MIKQATLALLLAGCTPMTEQQKEELQFNKMAWLVDYGNAARNCMLAGGIMIIEGPTDFKGRPRYKTRYYCAKR